LIKNFIFNLNLSGCGGNFPGIYLARQMAIIVLAPFCFRIFAHSFRVEPVVKTSSTKMMFLFFMIDLKFSLILKIDRTFCWRKIGSLILA